MNMEEGHASSQSSRETKVKVILTAKMALVERCSWVNDATKTGVVPVWRCLPVGVVRNHLPGASSGCRCWPRRRAGHKRLGQHLVFPHRG